MVFSKVCTQWVLNKFKLIVFFFPEAIGRFILLLPTKSLSQNNPLNSHRLRIIMLSKHLTFLLYSEIRLSMLLLYLLLGEGQWEAAQGVWLGAWALALPRSVLETNVPG